MESITLFNKEIPIRTHHCQLFNYKPKIANPYIDIYVKTKGCNAKCLFCEFSNDAAVFDFEKYLYILNEIKNKIRVKKFAFTGGEPTTNYKQFYRILEITRENFPNSNFVLNTNGYNLDKINFNELDSISLSRHHYFDKINNEILGFKAISKNQLKKLKKKKVLHLSCNLIKGYIDSKEEIYKFLEFADSIGIESVGFVSLMPVNSYCKDNLIDFNDLDLISERFNLTKTWTYENYCKCSNYIYITKKLNVITVYYKNTYNPYDINTNLVFDGQNLTIGFSNDKII